MSAKTEALNMWPIPENSLQKDPVIDQNAEATAQAMVGIVTRNLIADANYTMLPADYLCNVATITDSGVVLTGGVDLIYPALFPRQTVINATAETLTLKMAGQTGVTLAAGAKVTIAASLDDVISTDSTGVGSGDFVGPASAVDGNMVVFDGLTGKIGKDGGPPGVANSLSTARDIDGQAFDGSADITVIAPGTHAATSKTTPVDADELPLVDSAASNVLKKLTWANLKATLKGYFDGVYAPSRNTVTAVTPASGTLTLDYALGEYFTTAPTANITTLAFSNLPGAGKGATIMLRFTQDTTPRTFAWPASFKWAGGVAGVVSAGSGAVDVIAMTTFDNGTTWRVTIAKAFA